MNAIGRATLCLGLLTAGVGAQAGLEKQLHRCARELDFQVTKIEAPSKVELGPRLG